MKRSLPSLIRDNSFIKFLFVGLLNAAFGYSVFAAFIWTGMHYAIASLLATVLGVLFNFKTVGALVFRNRKNSLLVRFAGVYVVTFCLNVLLLKAFNYYQVNMYLAGFLLLGPMAVIAYVLNRHFVFHQRSE